MFKKFALLAVLTAGLVPSAWACPSCSCGDPTLTLMGTEKNYPGRLRVAADYQNRSEYQGSGIDRELLQEDRVTLGASYAFSRDFSIGLRLPFSSKSAQTATLGKEKASGLGDAEITARYTLNDNVRHVWGVQAGLRVPTSSEQKDSSGNAIDIDAQPGTGAWAPSAGIWYGYFRFPQSVYLSVVAISPDGSGYQGLNQGTAVLATATSQYALNQQWSLQLGLEARFAGYNRFNGVKDANSGGNAAFVVPGIVWSPTGNWLLHVSGQIPAMQDLHGVQDERGDIRVGIAYDLGK